MATCNCIKEVQERVKDIFEKTENVEKVTELIIDNGAFRFVKEGTQIQLYSPMIIEYDYKNKKGEIKHKKGKANMGYTYCPFCGKSYDK